MKEQCYQCIKAVRHEEKELAEKPKEMENSSEIKIERGEITCSEAWNEAAPQLLWDLFDQKMSENPELLDRLLETAHLPLVEAYTIPASNPKITNSE